MPNEEDTKINKTSISNSESYEEIGEFWGNHSLDTYWSETEEVTFEIDLKPNNRLAYYGIEENLSDKLLLLAKSKGISAKALLNSWIEEKLEQESA
jgi:predicted HicB family RNase H-like nuclease